jgi:hypothetical protein
MLLTGTVLITLMANTASASALANSAYVQIVDAKWPKSANRMLLKPESPMPLIINLRDITSMHCKENDEPKGEVIIKLKNGKSRVPALVPINQDGVLKIALNQTFISGVGSRYQTAYALAQVACQKILFINAKQGATYNVEMSFNGKRCNVIVIDNALPVEPVKYTEYSDGACFDNQLRYY